MPTNLNVCPCCFAVSPRDRSLALGQASRCPHCGEMVVMDAANDINARLSPLRLIPSEMERLSLTSDEPKKPKARVPLSDRILGLCYEIHAVAVGGFFLMVVLVNSQGARSAEEAFAGIAAAVLQPLPMIVAGCALLLGWRRARLLAVILPVVVALCYAGRMAWPPESVRPAMPPFFPFYFCILQVKNIPGAAVLALVAASLMLLDASTGGPPSESP